MPEALNVFLRWLHISSVVTLIGGMIFGRLVMAPSLATLAPDAREALAGKVAAAFRPLVLTAMTLLVLSGVYNIVSNPGHTARYHMLLGIKLLLVAHVFAASVLITRPVSPRRTRLMTGTFISGLIIIFISAWLRRIF